MKKPLDFTKEQLKAIEHDTGGLQLIACAGAGKTEVVSRRIARLIQKGVKPSEIVAFTFTEKAADEMKTRIRNILDAECPERADFGDMYIGTIHSFCFFMLKELEPRYKSFDVMDEAQRVALVSQPDNYYNKLKLVAFEHRDGIRKYTVINRFLGSIDIIRDERIDPDKLTDKTFAEAYTHYIDLLDHRRYLDFAEMIARLVNLLENKEVAHRLHEKIKHLVVDEYQDVNKIQEALVEIISKGCKSVCVVGDDDQCVYQWRGSDPNYIINFEKRYFKRFHIEKIPIETNFRSTQAIVHTASQFISRNKMRLSKTMKTPEKPVRIYEKGDIIHQHFKDEAEEFEFICDTIKKIEGAHFVDKKGVQFSLSLFDIAILVRTNEDAAKIIPYLERYNIDFVLGGGKYIFESPEVQLARGCMVYLFSADEDQQITPESLLEEYTSVFPKSTFKLANPKRFIEKMKRIKKEVEEITEKGDKDYLQNGLQIFYHAILNALGIEDFPFPQSYYYNLAVLSQAISDYESVWIRLRAKEVKYFFGFLSAFAQSHYTETMHSDPSLIKAVKIMTVHKAKGLEFPVVFLPGLVTKRAPNPPVTYVDKDLYDEARYIGNIEDERRVFYTAMTRSEKYLFMTGAKIREGRKKEYDPHAFIGEIEREYVTNTLPTFRKVSTLSPRATNGYIYPLSFSEINIYNRCPYDFRLRHIFGYNAGVPVTFGYGTNVHNILNVIHKKYKKSPPTEEEIDHIFDNMFHMRYATSAIAENMKKAGRRIVKNYVKKHGEKFQEILETEKQFEFVLGEALISGQIDLIKRFDETKSISDIEIIDFKTEKNKSYSLDYETQLRLYSIACIQSLGLNPKKAAVHHLDTGDKDYVMITPEKLAETKNHVADRVDRIFVRKDFPPNRGRQCTECDYEKICHLKGYCWNWKFNE